MSQTVTTQFTLMEIYIKTFKALFKWFLCLGHYASKLSQTLKAAVDLPKVNILSLKWHTKKSA